MPSCQRLSFAKLLHIIVDFKFKNIFDTPKITISNNFATQTNTTQLGATHCRPTLSATWHRLQDCISHTSSPLGLHNATQLVLCCVPIYSVFIFINCYFWFDLLIFCYKYIGTFFLFTLLTKRKKVPQRKRNPRAVFYALRAFSRFCFAESLTLTIVLRTRSRTNSPPQSSPSRGGSKSLPLMGKVRMGR